jgi:hypothetical protein
VKPAAFEYVAARTLDEALEALAASGDAKVLAGGQSLVPLLNMRLARPALLVDINCLHDLDYIRRDDGHLAIGALTRQRALERSDVIAELFPLLVAATARRTAGWITSMTGMPYFAVYRSRASRRTAADAELQAIVSSLTPESTSSSITPRALARTSAMGNGPYGPLAVSPT